MDVKELLHTQVEEMKLRRRVRVGEIMTANIENDDSDPDDLQADEYSRNSALPFRQGVFCDNL